MPLLNNPQKIQVFNGMAKFYKCFIKNFAIIMAPITKLTKKKRLFYAPPNSSRSDEVGPIC